MSSPSPESSVAMTSPLKSKSPSSPFEEWASKNLDPAAGVPYAIFGFPSRGIPRGCRILLLSIITAGKANDSAMAQGLDLRTREGVTTLLKSVYQLTPSTLVKSTSRHWLLEIPDDHDYKKIRRGVFALSTAVGFMFTRPDTLAFRTITGFFPGYWSKTVEEVREFFSGELVESVEELRKETVGAQSNPLECP